MGSHPKRWTAQAPASGARGETATWDLEAAVKRNKFGVLHVHDLQKTLKEKGVDFPNACTILEVCNP